MENGRSDIGRVGREEWWWWCVCVWRVGGGAAMECVIEFFPFPSSVWARMCVWPSVLGADTEVSVWKDAVSPFCLPSQMLRGATPALLFSRHLVCPPARSHFSRCVKAKITQLSGEKNKITANNISSSSSVRRLENCCSWMKFEKRMKNERAVDLILTLINLYETQEATGLYVNQ